MRLRPSKDIAGVTMIELLVVMGIIAILAAITIPALSGGGGLFSRDTLGRASQLIHTKLQAAQIYANTYHVDTAVVYALDNWTDPASNPGLNPQVTAPLLDSQLGTMRRAIVAAAVMYELPSELKDPLKGKYVPVPTEDGNFETLPGDAVVLLLDPKLNPPQDDYVYDLSRYEQYDGGVRENGLYQYGMSEVTVITGDPGLNRADIVSDLGLAPDFNTYVTNNSCVFPAHLFNRVGKLAVLRPELWIPDLNNDGNRTNDFNAAIVANFDQSIKERYEIFVAPSPMDDLNTRFVIPDQVPNPPALIDYRTVPIEIFRSTGRIKVGG